MPCDLGAYWKSRAAGKDFRIQAVARGPREEAMAKAEEAVQRQRGDILDFKMFGNLSLNLVVEASGAGVLGVVDALARLGWQVELAPDRTALAGREADRLEGTLQVTFPDADGELAIPQPAVPG